MAGIAKKCVVLAMSLLLLAALATTVSAEAAGYWTETTDSEGRPIRIFTYTEPVEITFDETDGAGCCGAPETEPAETAGNPEGAQPVAVIDNAPVRMAQAEELPTAQAGPSDNPMAGIAALGLLLLLGLGAALYKAV